MLGALWIVRDFSFKSIQPIEKKKWKFPGCLLCYSVSFQDGREDIISAYLILELHFLPLTSTDNLAELFFFPLWWENHKMLWSSITSNPHPLPGLTGLTVVLAQSGGYCPSPQDKVHVELITGKVYTAPEDMLDSRPGTLMLTDCIDLCLSNSSCTAANFETGLCVLFSSSAQQFPGQSGPPAVMDNLHDTARYDWGGREEVLL